MIDCTVFSLQKNFLATLRPSRLRWTSLFHLRSASTHRSGSLEESEEHRVLCHRAPVEVSGSGFKFSCTQISLHGYGSRADTFRQSNSLRELPSRLIVFVSFTVFHFDFLPVDQWPPEFGPLFVRLFAYCGLDRLWPNRLWPILVFQGFDQFLRTPNPKDLHLDLNPKPGDCPTFWGSPPRDRPKVFFSLSHLHFVLFFSLSGCLLVEFRWCF